MPRPRPRSTAKQGGAEPPRNAVRVVDNVRTTTPEDNETPGMQSGPHWEGQNGLPACSVSAWCGVAGDRGRVGGEFLGSARGLWVVSCGQFGFHGEAAHLPRKRGCSVEETRHCTTQAPPSAAPTAWTTGSATPTGPFRRWGSGCMPFPGDCIPEARNGRGIKETAFKPPGKQPVGLLGAYVLNLCQ